MLRSGVYSGAFGKYNRQVESVLVVGLVMLGDTERGKSMRRNHFLFFASNAGSFPLIPSNKFSVQHQFDAASRDDPS